MSRSEDEARLDRFLDDPREEQLTLEPDRPYLAPCPDCGVPGGECRLGGPPGCPVYRQRRGAAA